MYHDMAIYRYIVASLVVTLPVFLSLILIVLLMTIVSLSCTPNDITIDDIIIMSCDHTHLIPQLFHLHCTVYCG